MRKVEVAHLIKLIGQLLVKLINGTLTKNTELCEKGDAYMKYSHVALIVGHEKSNAGALAYNGEYERFYNEKVAKLASKLVSKRKCKVFYRDGIGRKGVAKKAAQWAGDNSLSIELHFNSFDAVASGTECLVLDKDHESQEVGKLLAKAISDEFNTKLRHINGLKIVQEYDRGGMNLVYMRKEGIESSVLIEPFFGDFRTRESEQFLESNGWSRYAETLAEFIDSL